LGKSPVEIVQGNRFIEVKPNRLKKVKLIKRILHEAALSQLVDFLLFVGADTSNEQAYRYLTSSGAEINLAKDNDRFVCCFSKRPSNAPFYLDDYEDVKFLLGKLRQSSQKKKRLRSFADLQSLSPLTKRKEAIRQD